MKKWIIFPLVLLTACSGYKSPSMSSDPSKMSADTLCYRYAYAKSDRALKDEIRARGLECEEILRAQPQSGQNPSNAVGW
ncbi:MAG: hypothetical protein WBK55_07425 [Alphaproteobacteria bacterium]